MALRERVYSILVEANGGDEHMTSLGASECLYNAGLGLRYVQVRIRLGCPLLLRQRRTMYVKGCESAAVLVCLLLVQYCRLRGRSNQIFGEGLVSLFYTIVVLSGPPPENHANRDGLWGERWGRF